MENNGGVPQTRQGGDREGVPDLTDDDVYRALAETRRRRLMYVLLIEEETTVGELARVLAGWDAVDTGSMTTPRDHERIVIKLDHEDLPLLEEAGLLTYDRESATISLEPLDEAVADLICQSVEADSSEST